MMMVGAVFVLMVLAVFAMAIGVLAGRKSLQGSCGGLKTIQGIDCMVCPTPCEPHRLQEEDCPHAQKKTNPHQSENRDSSDKSGLNKNVLSSTSSAIEGAPCN